ncbi:type II toxin-antitoxin system MqsA family antitoxin [Rhodopseudomonas palustris]|uniref:Type II toxin-antitoxin system MqsA family antitoxin n=1 Tax=Thiospirillum jenense TaxID=1653858 RepID=A0A839HEE4_9GAMM|nr:type II toxin-antitoxin system MqsA family antitoxin [Thiospirillum jenense]MBB1089711.1 type II toxin-antitoxin system MqsA family antitoxin [Rhodopseudomonas palustris]MBB1124812.1 type II toxin-antitoxin system MqsA family antitoxin [Thiospirillum jenense]
MNCTLCKHGETRPGVVTVSLNRDDTLVVIKGVPADVCDNCGEYYLNSAIAMQLYEQAAAAVARHAEVEILRFAA